MTAINLSGVTVQAEQPSDVEKCINDCTTKFNEILLGVLNEKDQEAHQMEATIFGSLLELGLLLLKLFFANHNQGDYGKTMETARGAARRGKKSEKTYFSVFGKVKVIRYLYYIGDSPFAPLDIILNLPVRCYSYFLSEMANLLNIREAYSEGANFLKKFFNIQLPVSASETISYESSESYEEYYELGNTLPKTTEAGEYTVVSFDGKGVPMIKKEAAKITGRQGKGKKKQKKKEALVGARYDIDGTPRTAEEVASNLVYPDQKEKERDKKEEKTQNIRYIASVEKPKKKVMEEIRDQVKDEDFAKNPLICVMDGSLYLWNLLKIIFGDIGNKVLILDIIHVSEYVWLIAHIKCKEGSEDAKQYVYEKLLLILQGKISSYIMELRREMPNGKWNESQLKKFRKAITYFINHREYMKYDEYLAKGYPIGSGVVESACSHVVRDRMEISGARWGIRGAESILKLRSVVKSSDWDEYWKFHTSNARDNKFFPDKYDSLTIKEKMCA